ncbi:MAG TPA: CheR family methyltransferase [Longimicrobiaceae bacterium]|nr:CheR family methyltransferase [Longimicrobiaceae bacterium]
MSSAPPQTDPEFETLLEFVRDERGFDFTGYKRSSLTRRVIKRMAEVGVEGFAEYRDFLARHPGEFTALFNTILINVTSFWRDPDAWEALVRDHLPALLAARDEAGQVRVWSAGCASGEETYTLVMVLAEALGVEAFRERVKIYATDVDAEALAQARQASYDARDLEAVPEALREKYFEAAGGRFVFRADLRRLVIFGRHDLVRDPPISHLDLLVSRNALMYFNAQVQARILNRFHFALSDGGLLFMGKAEMMRAHGDLFRPVDLKARIFGKVARGASLRERLLLMAPSGGDGAEKLKGQVRLREAALDAHNAAQLVVDTRGGLAVANARARHLFGLAPADLGRPLRDLTVSYRPVELRSRIEEVLASRVADTVPAVELPLPDGEPHVFDVQVVPLLGPDRAPLGVSVTFVDITGYQRLQAELQQTHQELETAFEELQSTNEELETTNEELQSTIEELETTNEELQSTNEELETMNEELQSTNEELETLNDELHRRTSELNDASAYVNSILASLRVAVAVLDRGSDVRLWNQRAEDLWGLRAGEVMGQALQNLDIGLPVERLRGPIRACMDERSPYEALVLDAVNRRGKPVRCRVTCAPLLGEGEVVLGAVLLMEEWKDGQAEP